MARETTTVKPIALPVHCDCTQGNCRGEVVEFANGAARELFIRCDPASTCVSGGSAQQQAAGFYECLPRILEKAGARLADVLLERVFCRDIHSDLPSLLAARQAAYNQAGVTNDSLPVASFVGQPPCTPGQAFELQVYALIPHSPPSAEVTRIPATTDMPGARVIEIDGFRHLYARGITGEGDSFRSQSDTMFAKAAKLLQTHGCRFKDVLRSWYYLADIDRDYAEFNRSRNQFFEDEQVVRLPAATGICGSLPGRKQCGMDLYALLNPEDATIEVMRTPTLNEAPEYGSAFSRGMKLGLPGKRVLFVSGTASVNELGETAHVGDLRRQIERTLLNIQQLLAPHGATFANLVQVISYLKSPSYLPQFQDVLNQWGLVNLPNSIVTANVCRPDLLVEVEAIAILP